jgi:uncharacterized short protein YbdD (DUF466 family)
MQARELTPAEVEAGRRGINDIELSATQIQALLRNMDASKQKWAQLKNNKVEYEEQLQKENEALYFNYPSLFQMHAEDRLDGTFFEMLALKRKIEKGEITREQATQIIGQKLHQRYIPEQSQAQAQPQAPTMTYEEYYRQTH